jgi:formate dehydrogenase subunit delta
MSNKIDILIRMANDIGNFFNAESDKELAANGIKNHISRSWDPRMRQAIISYNKEDGSKLSDLARQAIAKLD